MPQDFAAPLPHNALLAISGDDAPAFLHGQLTNDVEALAVGAAQWNGWCSPKGRLLATFLLVRRAEGFLLMLPAELAAPIAKRLAMFVLRSKVTIRDVTAEHALWGLAGEAALRSVGAPAPLRAVAREGRLVVALDGSRAVLIAPAGSSVEGPARGTTQDWDRELIHVGIPVITLATQDAFVPQMANFELVGGVSFKKGCYPGQEIVARTQYRGILKRRMALAHVPSPAQPKAGDAVYSPAFGDQAAGMIVNAAPSSDGDGFDFLVVAQLESLAAGELHLGSLQGPAIRIVSHPAAQAA
jgi:folate-binding protein YgfZ